MIVFQIKPHLKSTVLLDIMTCCPLRVNRRFEGTYRLNFKGLKNNPHRILLCLPSAYAGIMLALDLEDVSGMFLRNVRLLSMEYTAVYPKRQSLFMTTAVRTSNPK
jgi:hypothetical protein